MYINASLAKMLFNNHFVIALIDRGLLLLLGTICGESSLEYLGRGTDGPPHIKALSKIPWQ